MIAMSTHGRSGLQRLMIGSVADKIVHHANVPVLLVRPPTH
jgi:nucleotide-binding universal stress UspA family protein